VRCRLESQALFAPKLITSSILKNSTFLRHHRATYVSRLVPVVAALAVLVADVLRLTADRKHAHYMKWFAYLYAVVQSKFKAQLESVSDLYEIFKKNPIESCCLPILTSIECGG
jgi:hypothetical protein